MKVLEKLPRWLVAPVLTRTRIGFALAVAVAIDAAQMVLTVPGWFGADEVLDTIAMVLTSAALGFHPLLLPTFVIELVPVVDMLPTWTACTAAVIFLRRKTQPQPPSPAIVVGPPLLPPPQPGPKNQADAELER